MVGQSDVDKSVSEQEDLEFKARATNSQIHALALYLSSERLLPGITHALSSSLRFRKSADYSPAAVCKWLRNAWNTEMALRVQQELDPESKRFALQWVFPQAYYAAFCQILAFFKLNGRNQDNHSPVLREFGQLVRDGHYPSEFTFCADGGKNELQLVNLRKLEGEHPIRFDPGNPRSVENKVRQALKSTREKHLDERRQKMQKEFLTQGGKPKKSLAKADWRRVSDRIGPTTVLSYLYRKRIKANYRDIQTFLHCEIDCEQIIESLVSVVSSISLIHESFTACLLGLPDFRALVASDVSQRPFLKARLQIIENLLSAKRVA